MNVHEFQAKQLFAQFGVPVLRGKEVKTPKAASQWAAKLNTPVYVVKAQIHAGGRGKAGGVKLVKEQSQVPEIAKELGADYMVYQEVEDLKAAILEGSDLDDLDMSCFDGRYVTGTVTEEYLAWVEDSQES